MAKQNPPTLSGGSLVPAPKWLITICIAIPVTLCLFAIILGVWWFAPH